MLEQEAAASSLSSAGAIVLRGFPIDGSKYNEW